MNSRFALALAGIIAGACTTMAVQDGGLAKADNPPGVATKAELLALQNHVTEDLAALYYRVEKLEEDREELQATVAELEARSPGLGAYDGEGNWLGTVVEHTPGDDVGAFKSLTVWHPGMGRLVRVKAGDIGGGLLFTEPNCAGMAYLRQSSAADIGRVHHGNLLVPHGSPSDVMVVSYGINDMCTASPEPAHESVYATKVLNPPYPVPIVGPISVR